MKKHMTGWILLFGLMISSVWFSACTNLFPGQLSDGSETVTEKQKETTTESAESSTDAVIPQLTANTDFDALESDRVSDEELRRIWKRYDTLDSFGYLEWYLGAYQFNHTNLLLQEINGSTYELITKYDGKSLLYSESVHFDEENHAKKTGAYMYFSKDGVLLASFDENGEPFVSIDKETVDLIGSDILGKNREKELEDFFSGVTYNETLKQYEYRSETWDCDFKIKDGYVVYIDNNKKLSESGKYIDMHFDFGTTEIDLPPVVAAKLSIFTQPDEELQSPDGEQVTKEELYAALAEFAEINLFDCEANLTCESTYIKDGYTETKIIRRDGRKVYSYESYESSSASRQTIEYIVIAEDLKSYNVYDENGKFDYSSSENNRTDVFNVLERFVEALVYNDNIKGYEMYVYIKPEEQGLVHGIIKIRNGHVFYMQVSGAQIGDIVLRDFGTTTVELPAGIQ